MSTRLGKRDYGRHTYWKSNFSISGPAVDVQFDEAKIMPPIYPGAA